MTRRRLGVWLAWIIIGVLTAVLTLAVVFYLLDPTHQWQLAVRYLQRQSPITFYGRVVDQSNQPVAGATVSLRLKRFNWNAFLGDKEFLTSDDMRLVTDSDGAFLVRDCTGISLGITRISCSGFLDIPERNWIRELEDLGFRYARDPENPSYIPNSASPAVFPLRRPDEPRVLFPRRGGSVTATSIVPLQRQPKR